MCEFAIFQGSCKSRHMVGKLMWLPNIFGFNSSEVRQYPRLLPGNFKGVCRTRKLPEISGVLTYGFVLLNKRFL